MVYCTVIRKESFQAENNQSLARLDTSLDVLYCTVYQSSKETKDDGICLVTSAKTIHAFWQPFEMHSSSFIEQNEIWGGRYRHMFSTRDHRFFSKRCRLEFLFDVPLPNLKHQLCSFKKM